MCCGHRLFLLGCGLPNSMSCLAEYVAKQAKRVRVFGVHGFMVSELSACFSDLTAFHDLFVGLLFALVSGCCLTELHANSWFALVVPPTRTKASNPHQSKPIRGSCLTLALTCCCSLQAPQDCVPWTVRFARDRRGAVHLLRRQRVVHRSRLGAGRRGIAAAGRRRPGALEALRSGGFEK